MAIGNGQDLNILVAPTWQPLVDPVVVTHIDGCRSRVHMTRSSGRAKDSSFTVGLRFVACTVWANRTRLAIGTNCKRRAKRRSATVLFHSRLAAIGIATRPSVMRSRK